MYPKHIDKEQGSLSLFMSILAVLATSLLLLGYFFISSKEQMKSKHNCREISLKSQQLIADGMNELLSMNMEAVKLQAKEKKAKLMIQRAKNPKLMAAAILYYKQVKLQQAVFRKKQLILISDTERKANLHLQIQLRQKAYQTLDQLKIHLTTFPKNSDSPTYVSTPDLESKRYLLLRWSKTKSVNNKNLNMQGECKTTLRKEKVWFPVIAKDKV